MAYTLAIILLWFSITPAFGCALQSMTGSEIGMALRAAHENIARAIAEIEKPSVDSDKRKILVLRLKRNKDLIERFLPCQEFQ